MYRAPTRTQHAFPALAGMNRVLVRHTPIPHSEKKLEPIDNRQAFAVATAF
jgi:hypothetical protein